MWWTKNVVYKNVACTKNVVDKKCGVQKMWWDKGPSYCTHNGGNSMAIMTMEFTIL